MYNPLLIATYLELLAHDPQAQPVQDLQSDVGVCVGWGRARQWQESVRRGARAERIRAKK